MSCELLVNAGYLRLLQGENHYGGESFLNSIGCESSLTLVINC